VGAYLLQRARVVLDLELTLSSQTTFLLWFSAAWPALACSPTPIFEKQPMNLAYLGAVALALMTLAAFITGINALYGQIERLVER
jgi:hypothetical protein